MDSLQRLLDFVRVGAECEETAEISGDFFEFQDYDEIEVVKGEFLKKYRVLVRAAAEHFGVPEFDGEFEVPDFPEWYEAERLAFWRVAGMLVYVALRHDDKELPFALVCG